MIGKERLKSLLVCLPEKDRLIANKYLEEGKLDRILEIVKSDIYKEKKKGISEEESEVLANMNVLKAEIVFYSDLLDLCEPDEYSEYEEY